MKKLSQKERRSRISQGLKLAWKRRHREKATVIDGHNRVAAIQSIQTASFAVIGRAALAFIKDVGGMENAKATIAMIEQVREAL